MKLQLIIHKIYELYKWLMFRSDKLLHLLVAFFLMFLIFKYIGHTYITCIGGILLSASCATLKEYIDYKDYGKFDIFDLLFTIIGSIIAIILV